MNTFTLFQEIEMGRKLIVVDPATGKQLILYEHKKPPVKRKRKRVMPVPYQQYQVPMEYMQYQMPQYHPPYQPPLKKRKMSTLTLAMLVFVLGWIPAGFGYPGATWLTWGLGLVILMALRK